MLCRHHAASASKKYAQGQILDVGGFAGVLALASYLAFSRPGAMQASSRVTK
jgi:hypothetical protein